MEEITDTGIPIEYATEVKAYSDLFCFFNQEHGLVLLNQEMDDIVKAVDKFKAQFNKGIEKPPCKHDEVMRQGDGFVYGVCSKCNEELY